MFYKILLNWIWRRELRALHVRASHIFISTQTTVRINFYSWRDYTSLFTHSQLSELTTLAARATFHSYTYSTVRVDDCSYLSHASLYNIIQLSELSAVATWATPHSVPSQSLLPLYLKWYRLEIRLNAFRRWTITQKTMDQLLELTTVAIRATLHLLHSLNCRSWVL